MDSVTLAFPEYRPDVFDRNAKLTRFMQNAVPRGDGFGPWFDLTRYTQTLPAALRSTSCFSGLRRFFGAAFGELVIGCVP